MTAMTQPALHAEPGATVTTRFNAVKHAVLSRYGLLPWEDVDEHHDLVAALAAEHRPVGPTEEHLIEELSGIIWRKRRLRLAEAAAHSRGLEEALAPRRELARTALAHLDAAEPTERPIDAICASTADTAEDLRDLQAAEAMARRALKRLGSPTPAYEVALAALHEKVRAWWAAMLARGPGELREGQEPMVADAECLRRFLEAEALPWFEVRRAELANRPLIREQAFGESFDPDRLERLGRYEVHLDRKLERVLGMLIKLKSLRQEAPAG